MSDSETAPERVIWRTTPVARRSWAVATGFLELTGLFFGIVGISHGYAFATFLGTVFVVGPGVGYWAYAIRPCIRIERGNLIVVNPIRTTTVSLASIASVRPGYSGITVVYFDGGQAGKVTAWAVQKANLSVQLGRRTRADIIAATIKQNADHARASE